MCPHSINTNTRVCSQMISGTNSCVKEITVKYKRRPGSRVEGIEKLAVKLSSLMQETRVTYLSPV